VRRIYAFYTAPGPSAIPFLCRGSYSASPRTVGAPAVDLVYLLLACVLVAATLGFLLICDRLGRR